MKKVLILTIGLIVLSLSACSNQQQTTQTDLKKNNQQLFTNKEKTKTSETSPKVEKDEVKISNRNNNTSKKNVKKEINEQEIKEVEKKYSKNLHVLENMWEDNKISKLSILANANCTWVCNLDMKNKLSSIEFQAAKNCYKQCVKKQMEAKQELEKIENQLNQEKQAYPEKCFQDAEQIYDQIKKNMLQGSQQWVKLPSKKAIVQTYANRCILIYGWTNYDCEKIKKYKEPYEKCKRLRQLQQDLDFIQNWKYKTFDDYLRNKNMF